MGGVRWSLGREFEVGVFLTENGHGEPYNLCYTCVLLDGVQTKDN